MARNRSRGTCRTTSALGAAVDPLTGTLVIHFGAATASAPITSATLVSGNTFVTISQPSATPGILTLTGTTDTVLSPPPGGVAATGLGATNVTFPAIPASINGFLHCNGSLCGLAGFVASVASPITGTEASIPPLVFPSAVASASGGFLGTITQIVTSPATVTVVTNYVGTETDRMFFVPEPGTWMLGISGFSTLALLCTLRLRRNG